MAKQDEVILEYRKRSTALLDALNDVNDVLAVVEGTGADDAARVAFFAPFFAEFPDYDLNQTAFFDSIVAWRALRMWLNTSANYVPINTTRTR